MAKAKTLTAKTIENMKPDAKRREVPDGHTRGLLLHPAVERGGDWAYRYRFAGKSKKFTIGPSPEIDLKAARERARDAAKAVARGEDPRRRTIRDEAAGGEGRRARSGGAGRRPYRERHNGVHRAIRETQEPPWEERSACSKRKCSACGAAVACRKSSAPRCMICSTRSSTAARRSPPIGLLPYFEKCAAGRSSAGIIEHSPCDKIKAPAPEQRRDRVLVQR